MKFARFLSGLLLVAAAILLLAAAPEARAAIFACAGTEITGDATTEGFVDCIDVLSFGESVVVPLDTSTGAGTSGGRPIAKPFRLVKPLDSSSTVWRNKLLTGTGVAAVTIIFTTTSTHTGQLDPYLEIKLINALVTEISMTADQNGVPTEVISLQALEVDWKYTPYDNTGTALPSKNTSWDFSAGTI